MCGGILTERKGDKWTRSTWKKSLELVKSVEIIYKEWTEIDIAETGSYMVVAFFLTARHRLYLRETRSSMSRCALMAARFNGGGMGRWRELPLEPLRVGCVGRGRPAGSDDQLLDLLLLVDDTLFVEPTEPCFCAVGLRG